MAYLGWQKWRNVSLGGNKEGRATKTQHRIHWDHCKIWIYESHANMGRPILGSEMLAYKMLACQCQFAHLIRRRNYWHRSWICFPLIGFSLEHPLYGTTTTKIVIREDKGNQVGHGKYFKGQFHNWGEVHYLIIKYYDNE